MGNVFYYVGKKDCSQQDLWRGYIEERNDMFCWYLYDPALL